MAEIMIEQEIDEDILQVYKVFHRDDKGINELELMNVMNKLLELKHIHKSQQKTPSTQKTKIDSDDEDQSPETKKRGYYQITLEEAREMIAEADMDGDGKLGYEEFAKILMEKPEQRAKSSDQLGKTATKFAKKPK